MLNTGAVLNGRALAQSAVTLDSNSVNIPVAVIAAPTTPAPVQTPSMTCSNLYWFDTANKICQSQRQFCGVYMYQGLQTFNDQQTCLNTVATQQIASSTPISVNVSSVVSNTTPLSSNSGFDKQVKEITTSLVQGGRGNNVMVLQQFLISQNIGSSAQALAKVGATAYFGALTRAALAEFQAKVGISPALGNFGPITRAYLSVHY